MPDASEAMKWILVLDLVIMSFYVIKLVSQIDKQQKDKK
jgi:hypothetical protein